jgi:chromosome condensin MukBEF ATPase and DNA-binding subunit MukB
MTTATTPPPAAPVHPAPVHLQADPDTRLEQLLAQYDMAKAESKKADEALKAITDGIKQELAAAAPDAVDIRVDSPDLAQPLRLLAIESWRVDATRLKTEAPETYVRYAKKSTAWQLRAVSS